MNTQVGKSVGIALLLAAGLLAVLFAMGVFAPAGVSAGVLGGSAAPEVTLDNTVPESTGVKMTITFTVNDTIDGDPDNDLRIVVPDSLVAGGYPTSAAELADATKIRLTQGTGDNIQDVGKIESIAPNTGTDGQVITIIEGSSNNLMEGQEATLVINGLTLGDTAIRADVLFGQGRVEPDDGTANSVDQTYNLAIFDPDDQIMDVSAQVDPDTAGASTTMVLRLTPTLDTPLTVDVTLPAEYQLTEEADSNTLITGITFFSKVGDDAFVAFTPTADGGTLEADADTFTLSATELPPAATDEEVVVEIRGLTNPSSAGTFEVEFVQGTAYPAVKRSFDTVEPTPLTLSDYGAGKDVIVTINAEAEDGDIRGGSDIVISMPGFGVPSSIDEDDVNIYSLANVTDDNPATTDVDETVPGYVGSPGSVSVSDTKITLSLPTRYTTGTSIWRLGSRRATTRSSSSRALVSPTPTLRE